MTLFDLDGEGEPSSTLAGPIYLVGVGGPEDEAGIGDVTSFKWRFCLVEPAEGLPIALGFRAMPSMMAFTKAVNGERPFTVPTEALRIELSGVGPVPLRLAIDPTASDLAQWLQAGRIVTRSVPELEA